MISIGAVSGRSSSCRARLFASWPPEVRSRSSSPWPRSGSSRTGGRASSASSTRSTIPRARAETVFLSHDTRIGRDVVIEPHVVIGEGVGSRTAPPSTASATSSRRRSAGGEIGPFARLRPGSDIGERAKIGNFVETKNTEIGEGAKANHLSYLGDTTVGPAPMSAPGRSPATMTASTSTDRDRRGRLHRLEFGPRGAGHGRGGGLYRLRQRDLEGRGTRCARAVANPAGRASRLGRKDARASQPEAEKLWKQRDIERELRDEDVPISK